MDRPELQAPLAPSAALSELVGRHRDGDYPKDDQTGENK
jgi:hypothetical protein